LSFNNTTYDKIIYWCQIGAKLMPKLTVTAEQENLMTNWENNAKKSAKQPKKNLLLPSSFKMPNLTYLAF